MVAAWERVLQNLASRLSGPLHLRLFLQPGMALLIGIKDGLKDASEDRPAYLWSIFTTPGHRMELLKAGLASVAKVLILAFVLDAIFQVILLRWFYPGEAILVAVTLAFVPYVLIRGPANRIAKGWSSLHRREVSTERPSRTARNQH